MGPLPTLPRQQAWHLPGPPLAGQFLQDPLPGQIQQVGLTLLVDAEFGRVLLDFCNMKMYPNVIYVLGIEHSSICPIQKEPTAYNIMTRDYDS